MRLTAPKIIIALSVISLVVQIVGGYAVIKELNQPPNLNFMWLALVVEIAAFIILAPFLRRFYRAKNLRFTYRKSLEIIFASEAYSNILPFGDYILQRYIFRRMRRPNGPIVEYVIVYYSFSLFALTGIFLICQLLVTLLYPNKVTDGFIGTFALVPFFFSAVFVAMFLVRKSPRVRARVQSFFTKYFSEPLQSPFDILKTMRQSSWQTVLLLMPLLLTWIIEGAAFAFTLYAFNVQAPFLLCLYVYSFVKVFRFVPIFPAGIGQIEAVSSLLFSAYGYPVLPVVGAAILFRLMSFWLPTLIGALSLFRLVKPSQKAN